MEAILGLIAAFGITIGLTFFGYETYQFLAPRYMAIDNKVFHESAQYNDGMLRDLENLEMEYKAAKSDEARQALKATAIHRFSIYPKERMTPELRSFYEGLYQ